MKKVPVVRLKTKQRGRVIEISGGPVLQNRLQSMGIYPGREITMLSNSMFRGPVAVKIGRAVIALGYGMAHKIIVETE